ncbi:MAG TPA: HAD family hydrolase [Xanthobacteraceae bacterium]|nr:HAD family hydrolase [Xanthobacteraceae bacterium]
MTPAALIFDFDGVILDSVGIKTQAMRRLFAAERPDHLADILDLHRRLGGISRYRKFDLIHSDILRRPLTPEASADLGRRFEALVAEGVLTCREIPGARMVLESHAGRIPLFVASGTPEEELRRITAVRGLDRYFVEIHGSPRGKPDILADVLRRHALDAARCVFVGDAGTDFEAARSCGVPFLGVVAPGLENPFGAGVCTVPDLRSFELALRRLGMNPLQTVTEDSA